MAKARRIAWSIITRDHSKGNWRSAGRCDLDRLKSVDLAAADVPQVGSLAGFLASSVIEFHLRLPSEKPIEASLLNGDDQDQRRLSSPFAGPPPRFGFIAFATSTTGVLVFRMGFELSHDLPL